MDDHEPWSVLAAVFFGLLILETVVFACIVQERNDLRVKYAEVQAKYEALDKLLTVKLHLTEEEDAK